MTLMKLIVENLADNGGKEMLELTKVISEFVEKNVSDKDKEALMKNVYGVVSGGHFNRMYADEAIKKMYYEDAGGTKHYAPYFTEDEVEEIFEKHKDDVSDYTIFDLAVTLNMMRSDNARFLEKYARDDNQKRQMVVDMAVEYLQDPDAPHPHSKVWGYLKG